MKKILTIGFLALTTLALADISPDALAKRQARSVHLQYPHIEGGASGIRGTVTVTETQTNTYFCILGWNTGYCGIQDKGADGNILIFSVWEPSDPFDFKAKPEDVNEKIRAQVLYSAPNVDVARFGGEGTGARTLTRIDWKVGERVTVQIECEPLGADRMAYTCFWKEPKTGAFVKIATISTLKKAGPEQGRMNGLFSFVEDFWRNYHSATIARRAEFSNIEVRPYQQIQWEAVTSARFTADRTPSDAIDAGRAANGALFLQTGGATKNVHVKLREQIK